MQIGCRCQASSVHLSQWGRGRGGYEASRAASAHVGLTKPCSRMETASMGASPCCQIGWVNCWTRVRLTCWRLASRELRCPRLCWSQGALAPQHVQKGRKPRQSCPACPHLAKLCDLRKNPVCSLGQAAESQGMRDPAFHTRTPSSLAGISVSSLSDNLFVLHVLRQDNKQKVAARCALEPPQRLEGGWG